MALNPLQERMAAQGQTPASAGMNERQAASNIEALLDDDGRDPGYRDNVAGDEGEADLNARERGQEPDEVREPQPEPDEDIIEDDDTAQAEGVDDEQDEQDDAENEGQDDQADDDDADGGQIQTLAEMAEALEVEPEVLLSEISHTFKAAGEERTATLAELVSGFQLKADYDRDKTALATTRREFENEQTARVQHVQQNAQVLEQQFQAMGQMVSSRLQDPQLLELQQTDTAAYLLQVRQIENEFNQLSGMRNQAAQQYNQFLENERNAFLQTEGKKLQQDIPDWGEEKLQVAVNTIKSLGFDDAEVAQNADSRFIKGALRLAELEAENAALKARIEKGEKAVKTVKKTVPKGIKPGKATAGRRTRGVDRSKVSKLRRAHGQNKSVQSAADVIEQLMN